MHMFSTLKQTVLTVTTMLLHGEGKVQVFQ